MWRAPLSFGEIVEEISAFTGYPQERVEERVWLEALDPGFNVREDVRRFGATPHRFDEEMQRVYVEGDGFIFETMVFWAKPTRQTWIQQALNRIQAYVARTGKDLTGVSVLTFGDGCGSDSLFLASQGLTVFYFDIPGSRTWDFAVWRFQRHGILGKRIFVVQDEKRLHERQYDVVLCFEVLEHVPKPDKLVVLFGNLLAPQGIVLVTDSFSLVAREFPTHLAENLRFDGRTPFIFARAGFALTWYNRRPLFKPMEFTRNAELPLPWLRLWKDPVVRAAWLAGRRRSLRRLLGRVDT